MLKRREREPGSKKKEKVGGGIVADSKERILSPAGGEEKENISERGGGEKALVGGQNRDDRPSVPRGSKAGWGALNCERGELEKNTSGCAP